MRDSRAKATAVLLALAFGAWVGLAHPHPESGSTPTLYPVMEVVDGDTLEIWAGDRFEELRLLNIDTPERGEPGYEAATAALREIVGQGPIRLEWGRHEPWPRGDHGRILALVYLGEYGQTCANLEMVRRGWSKYWTKYGRSAIEQRFQKAETQAREAGRGLWAEEIAPASSESEE